MTEHELTTKAARYLELHKRRPGSGFGPMLSAHELLDMATLGGEIAGEVLRRSEAQEQRDAEEFQRRARGYSDRAVRL